MTKKVPKGFEKIIQYWKCKKAYERKGKGKKIMITSLGQSRLYSSIFSYISSKLFGYPIRALKSLQ